MRHWLLCGNQGRWVLVWLMSMLVLSRASCAGGFAVRKTDGSGYGQHDAGNDGGKPASGDGQRGGFVNRVTTPTSRVRVVSRSERRQVIVGEAFESFRVGSARTPTTVERMMLIEKLGEELPGGGFGGRMGGSPDFLPVPLETNPIGRVPFVDRRHVQALAPCRVSHGTAFLQTK